MSTTLLYDTADRLRIATTTTAAGGPYVSTFQWTQESLPRGAVLGDGTTACRAYDAADRLSELDHSLSSLDCELTQLPLASPMRAFHYWYDAFGNRNTIDETWWDLGGSVQTEAMGFAHDGRDRLAVAKYADKADVFGYDLNGNRKAEKVYAPNVAPTPEGFLTTGVLPRTSKTLTYNHRDQLLGIDDALTGGTNLVAYGYDDNGRTARRTDATTAQHKDYSWNADDSMRDAIDEAGTRVGLYAYDASSLCRSKLSSSAAEGDRRYVYDGQSLVAELDATSGAPQLVYLYGTELLGVADYRSGSEQLEWFHRDGMRSVIERTRSGASGAERAAGPFRFDAWGQYRALPTSVVPTADGSTEVGYTAHLFDAEAGLVVAGNGVRYYAPELGRFHSQDALEGEMSEAPSLHRYAYAHAAPLRFWDPSGYLAIGTEHRVSVEYLGGPGGRLPAPEFAAVSSGAWVHRPFVMSSALAELFRPRSHGSGASRARSEPRGGVMRRLRVAAFLLGAVACSDATVDDGGGSSEGCAVDPCACRPLECLGIPSYPACASGEVCAADASRSCDDMSACGSVTDFACKDHCCIELCSSTAECAGRAECTAAALGCVCDHGLCKPKVCSSDAECGGEGLVCEGGTCTAAPTPAEVTACRLEPRYGVLHDGVTLQLFAKAYSGRRPLSAPASIFSFVPSGPAAVDAAGRVTGGSADGAVTITATAGTASCTAVFTNFAAAAAGDLRVVVTDELTGLPVVDATVKVEGIPALTGSTGAQGAVAFTGVAGTNTISVFHADHGYVTVVGTSRRDLLIELRRNRPGGLAGGFTGVFTPAALFEDNYVHLGQAGASIPGNLIDLSLEALVGPSILTMVDLGGGLLMPLPAGEVSGLCARWFKGGFVASGVPGVCADAAASAAGSCGTRSGWGLAGRVPLSALPMDYILGGAGDPGMSTWFLMAAMGPSIRSFGSAVALDVEFELHPTVDGGVDGRLPDSSKFTVRDLEASHELALRSEVTVPTLPSFGGVYTDRAIVLGGASAPGRGLVPLGLVAGIDADSDAGEAPDGKINDSKGESSGKLVLRLAPNHSGLEGSRYAVLALAFNPAGLGARGGARGGVCTAIDRSGCVARAGVVKTFEALPHGTPVAFAHGFVGFAETATYDAASRGYDTHTRVDGANVYRVNLKDDNAREWHVFFAGTTAWTLPMPPDGLEDRSRTAAGGRSALSVQAMRVAVDLDGLVDFDGTNFSNLVEVTTAFSTTDIPE